ncbi:DNA polymerase [Pleionea sp. CnH1-48]|uniref:DNA polymerase n=1 Tax=Pleionea sp. CnH1-48 TaxID=2954494 RepID=UPI00209747B4|nr:DNA polymerase [Pleionea sp. CnH1-48]MCO7225755.1 DNA polymerase [Pleionea sp. CnH1-48]
MPVIQKLYGVNLKLTSEIYDTLVSSRLIYSNIKDIDFQNRGRFKLPSKLLGSHSLKAWGYRLGNHKGEFAEVTDWQHFTEEMLEYCTQDTKLNLDLWRKLQSKNVSQQALQLEHQAAFVLSQQERNGFCFDEGKAIKLYAHLSQKRSDIEREIQKRFKGWWKCEEAKKAKRTIKPKKGSNALATVKGAEYCKIKWIDFNPSSRQHIERVLTNKGWKPKEFTPSGQAKIDETILSKLPYEEAKLFAKQFLLQKRIAQLAEGNQGWLKAIRQGKIHGSVNPNGAVTGRATHAYPNVAQVPSARAPFGRECRELWTVPNGWFLLGTDASGLELRCLGHFMSRWDNGAYIDTILNGDIHTVNQKAAGLPTRDHAKTFIYSVCYGAGDQLVGSIVEPHSSAQKQRNIGKKLKTKFFNSVPALKYLKDAVAKAAKRGFIVGLDGRPVYIRSAHAALNTLLQSAGALICKAWIVELERLAIEAGLKHGWHGNFAYCAWVHDELQIACKTKEVAEHLSKLSQDAIRNVEKMFSFKCPLATDSNIGKSWYETH